MESIYLFIYLLYVYPLLDSTCPGDSSEHSGPPILYSSYNGVDNTQFPQVDGPPPEYSDYAVPDLSSRMHRTIHSQTTLILVKKPTTLPNKAYQRYIKQISG